MTNMKKLWLVLSMVMVLALATTGFAFAAPAQDDPPTLNLVELALAANEQTGDFDTLIAAVTCPYFNGGLVQILTAPRPLTVFAPTDGAFGRLGLSEKNICTLPKEDLKYILFYHITNGRVNSGQVVASEQLMMLNKQYAPIVVGDGSVLIANAPIVAVDFMATNGIIHVIDGVMLPPTP